MIAIAKSDGLVNIAKIVNIANQILARTEERVFQPLVDTNACVTDTKEKIVINLIPAIPILARTVVNVATSMGRPLARANSVILEINVKRTTVQIAILMRTVSTDTANVELVSREMGNKDARKHRIAIQILV